MEYVAALTLAALTLATVMFATGLALRHNIYRPRRCAATTVADLQARLAADRTFLPIARGW